MRRLIASFLMVIVFALALTASAEIKTVNWVVPTQYNNGDPLPATDIDTYTLGCGPTTGDRTTDTRQWARGATPPRAEDFSPGVWFCALRFVTTNGATHPARVSDWSNETTFNITVRPNPPTSLTIL